MPLSTVDETDSVALSTDDFWESGVAFSFASARWTLVAELRSVDGN